MTDPNDPPPSDGNYPTAAPFGNASTLILLTVIFNFVMAALDCLYAIMAIGAAIFMFYIIAHPSPENGSPPPPWFPLVYLGLSVPALAVSILKCVAAVKLKRRSPNARAWGLAAGIAGCTQLWCSTLCFIPIAVGVFTIVAMCQSRVRAFLVQDSASLAPTPQQF